MFLLDYVADRGAPYEQRRTKVTKPTAIGVTQRYRWTDGWTDRQVTTELCTMYSAVIYK